MSIRSRVESEYAKQADALATCEAFQVLETGRAESKSYDDFIANVCKTHLKSPQILAFLYSAAPPSVVEDIKHNLLEELGLDEEGISHPKLLVTLAKEAGFSEGRIKELETFAEEELRRKCCEPILYGTLKEIGLSALLETVAFEWMLSRLSSRMAAFLRKYRGLSEEGLQWFSLHSEVDIRHAEEGLDSVEKYIQYYEFDPSQVESILGITFRANVFIKRYFGEMTLARQTGMLR